MATYNGSSGSDNIKGTNDSDTISGKSGDDTLYGDSGASTDSWTFDALSPWVASGSAGVFDPAYNGSGNKVLYLAGAGTNSVSTALSGANWSQDVAFKVELDATTQFGSGSGTDNSGGGTFTVEIVVDGTVVGSATVATGTASNTFQHYSLNITWNGAVPSNPLATPQIRIQENIGSGHNLNFDNVSVSTNNVTPTGTSNDSLYGGGGADTIYGGAGNDSIFGGTGNDTIDGGDGVDGIQGGVGNDNITGGAGADYIFGDSNPNGGGDNTQDFVLKGYIQGDNYTLTADSFATVPNTKFSVASATEIRFVDPDGILDNDDAADEVVTNNGKVEINGKLYSYSYDYRAVYQGSDGTAYHFLVIDVDLDGSGTISGSAENGQILIPYWPKVPPAGTTFTSPAAETTGGPNSFTDLYSFTNVTSTTTYDDTIDGGAGNDYLYGGIGKDTISGGADNDHIYGGDGNDTEYGGDGVDYLYGEAGNDTEYGGDGNDYLYGGDGDDKQYGDAGIDHIYGGDGNDVQYGGTEGDFLYGGNGNDAEYGGDGNDYLYGGTGNDSLNGDAGIDEIFGGVGTDTINGGDDADLLYGGGDADNIHGDAGADNINGGTGNDTIDGGSENDYVQGGFGNDTILGGTGDDRIYGDNEAGNTNDFVVKGYIQGQNYTLTEGTFETATKPKFSVGSTTDIRFVDPDGLFDTDDAADEVVTNNGKVEIDGQLYSYSFDYRLFYDGSDGQRYHFLVIDVDLNSSGTISGPAENGQILIPYWENIPPAGTTFSNPSGELSGPAGFSNLYSFTTVAAAYDDTVYGGDGNDTVYGGEGNDTVYGGTGVDVLSGDAGNDSLYGDAGNDSLYGGVGNDTLYGGTENDNLWGGDGNDIEYGGSGVDHLRGEAGQDTLYGGYGTDTLDGGDNNDTLYGDAGADVLNGDAGDDLVYGGEGNDTITGGTGTDTLYGDAGNDNITSGDENDTVYGGTGVDTITTGAGASHIEGGVGNDTVYAGDGNDTIYGDSLDGNSNDYVVMGYIQGDNYLLTNGDFSTVHQTKFQVASPAEIRFIDDNGIIDGDVTAETISAGAGKVEIKGVQYSYAADYSATYVGSDGITYEFLIVDVDLDGSGKISGANENGQILIPTGAIPPTGVSLTSTGAVTANTTDFGQFTSLTNYVAATYDDELHGGTGNDTIYGGIGNDTIQGDAGVDLIYGDAGNDIIDGGADKDEIYGGTGNDTINGGTGHDLIYGGEGVDTLYGDDGYDNLWGGEGDDNLYGGVGIDRLRGDAGNDTLYGGNDSDYLEGGEGNDTLYGDLGNDFLWGGTGDDTLNGGDGADQLEGQAGNDTLNGDAGNDKIYGGGGVDTINGGTGADTIDAGTGNDIVDGGEDSDIIEGGIGNDTIQGGAGADLIYGDNTEGNTQDFVVKGYIQGENLTLTGDSFTTVSDTNFSVGDPTEIRFVDSDGLFDTDDAADEKITGTGQVEINGQLYSYNFDYRSVYTGSDGVNYHFMVIDVDLDGSGDINGVTENGKILIPYWQNIPPAGTSFTAGGNDIAGPAGFSDLFGFTKVAAIYDDTIDGGADNDVIYGGIGNDTISGGTGNDQIHGDDGNDTLKGEEGSDNLWGGEGEDKLYGGDGIDRLRGDSGNDTLYGGNDTDYLFGGDGNDFLYGDAGNDQLSGDAGNDEIYGGDGIDRLWGGAGNDTLRGGNDTDYLEGGAGDDVLHGDAGDDSIKGDSGNDTLYGGAGNDTLEGGTGNDALYVGAGDSAYGGDDRDIFYIDPTESGSGSTITIYGGTGSTSANDVDDYDEIIFGAGFSVVPGSYSATIDEAGSPTTDNSGNAASSKSYTGSLQITDGTNTYTINFTEIEQVICFVRGTLIETDRGPVAVEFLRKDDLVLTKDHDAQPIRWIGSRAIGKAELEAKPNLYPIKIAQGALGHQMPEKDLFVSPQHRVVAQSKALQKMIDNAEGLIAANKLLDFDGIDFVMDCDEVEYFHILFDNHEIIYANGAEAESLLLGNESLKSLSKEAVQEIFEIFPEFSNFENLPFSARPLLDGKTIRKLTQRIKQNNKYLFENSIK